MKINTKYHGERQYTEQDIIVFNKGLAGFEKLHRFILFPVEENEIFNILHSIENNEIGFVVVSPFYVKKDYEFNLDENTIKVLNIDSPEDVLVLNTVTLSSQIEVITTNLKAPIIINIKHKIGEQIILDNDAYEIKHPLFKE